MIYYLIPLFVCLIGAIEYDINQKGKGRVLWTFLYIYSIVLIGARFEVGGDTINYMGFWNMQTDLSQWTFNIKEYFAPGYSLLCALSYTISSEFYIFQFIHAIILNTLLFLFIYKKSTYKFTVLIIIYWITYLYFTTEILREALAVLIFTYNYSNLKRHKWFNYYLGVIISILFHYSSLMLIFLPFITWIKFDKLYIYCCIITCIALLSFSSIVGIFESIAIIGDKITGYAEDTTHGMLADFMALLRGFIFPLGVVLLMKFGMHRTVKYENMIAVYTLFHLASYFSPIIFSRFANYFVIFYAIFLGDILINCIRTSIIGKKNAIIVIVFFIFLYGSDYVMYQKYIRWIPYYSIWNPKQVNRDNYN